MQQKPDFVERLDHLFGDQEPTDEEEGARNDWVNECFWSPSGLRGFGSTAFSASYDWDSGHYCEGLFDVDVMGSPCRGYTRDGSVFYAATAGSLVFVWASGASYVGGWAPTGDIPRRVGAALLSFPSGVSFHGSFDERQERWGKGIHQGRGTFHFADESLQGVLLTRRLLRRVDGRGSFSGPLFHFEADRGGIFSVSLAGRVSQHPP